MVGLFKMGKYKVSGKTKIQLINIVAHPILPKLLLIIARELIINNRVLFIDSNE